MIKILIVFFGLTYNAQQDEVMQNIRTAIKMGSSKELVQFCNNTVEIKMGGENLNYSKKQATVVLKNFFTKNPPKEFTYIHQGTSPEGLGYSIGRYIYEDGAFRVVMLIKKIGNSYLIDTLNFIKE